RSVERSAKPEPTMSTGTSSIPTRRDSYCPTKLGSPKTTSKSRLPNMTGSRAAVMGFMRIRGEYGQIKGVQAPVFALGELKYRGCVRGLIARVLWKWQCRINRKLPFFPKGEGSSSYSLRAASTNIFAENAHRSCALMLGITTYGRPNECGALILGLARSLRHAGMIEDSFLTVVRDTSEHDYAPVLQLLEQHFPGRFAF